MHKFQSCSPKTSSKGCRLWKPTFATRRGKNACARLPESVWKQSRQNGRGPIHEPRTSRLLIKDVAVIEVQVLLHQEQRDDAAHCKGPFVSGFFVLPPERELSVPLHIFHTSFHSSVQWSPSHCRLPMLFFPSPCRYLAAFLLLRLSVIVLSIINTLGICLRLHPHTAGCSKDSGSSRFNPLFRRSGWKCSILPHAEGRLPWDTSNDVEFYSSGCPRSFKGLQLEDINGWDFLKII